ncbi:MAG TPA: hypothetical protein VFG93_08160 [Gaiellaceae bacterium]|nr:hypothetical protein [Gaiellaceae bacterium]
MSTKPMLLPVVAASLLAATLPLAAGCGGSGSPADAVSAKLTAAQSAQRVAVSTRDTELIVKGADSLHAGFVRLDVRNVGRGEHAIELVRLKRQLTTRQLLEAFGAEKRELFEALGGIQQVVRGRPWEMTERLVSGSYALLDFAQNGPKPNYARGLYKRFDVAAREGRSVPPATVGEIDMRDFSLDFRLPNRFSGRGVVKITNAGKTSHEISLVRIEPGYTQHEVLNLILAGATKPPEWASIVELLSVLDPANTVYVRFDLNPGRYVALCLMNAPGSQTLHAQLGMIGTFDVV